MFCKPTVSLREKRWCVWHGILFEEPSPTGSRPRDLIGLYKQQKETPPPQNTREGKGSHGEEKWPKRRTKKQTEERKLHPVEAQTKVRSRVMLLNHGGVLCRERRVGFMMMMMFIENTARRRVLFVFYGLYSQRFKAESEAQRGKPLRVAENKKRVCITKTKKAESEAQRG